MRTSFLKDNWLSLCILIVIILSIVDDFIAVFSNSFLFATFVGVPLMLLFTALGIVLLIISIINLIRNIKTLKLVKFFPIGLSLLLLYCILFNPFHSTIRKIEFALKQDDRMEIVNLFVTDDTNGLISLPAEYEDRNLSADNVVVKMNEKFFFYNIRGVTDNFSGYIYSPNGIPPTKEDVQADIIYLQKMNEHWYFVSCT